MLPPRCSGIQPFMQIKLPRISQPIDELAQFPKYQRSIIIRRLWPDVRFQLPLLRIYISNEAHIFVQRLHANNQKGSDDPSSKSKIATGKKTRTHLHTHIQNKQHTPKHTASHTHAHEHTHTHTHTHCHPNTYMHTNTHTPTHMKPNTHTHANNQDTPTHTCTTNSTNPNTYHHTHTRS